MKDLWLFMGIFMAGCSAHRVDTTLFLKEDSSLLYNLKGDTCLESGIQILKAPNGELYRMITIYENCDVHKARIMEEFEPKQWLIKPKIIPTVPK